MSVDEDMIADAEDTGSRQTDGVYKHMCLSVSDLHILSFKERQRQFKWTDIV